MLSEIHAIEKWKLARRMHYKVSRLVERDEEVALGAQMARAAANGSGGLLVVRGPAGIGKTAVLREVAHAARQSGLTPLTSAGSELTAKAPFAIIRELVAPVVRGPGAPLLNGSASLAAPLFDGRSSETQIDALIHGTYWVFANAADRQPLCVIVDDAHWADVESLRALLYLSQRAEALRLVLCVGARHEGPDAQRALVESLQMRAGETAITLGGLSPEGTARLLGVAAQVTREEAIAYHEVTGGNPFYLKALLSTAPADVSSIRSVGPPAVAQCVNARLDLLPASSRTFAQAAAILGNEATLARCAALASVRVVEAEAMVDGLARASILGERGPVRFVHAIVRQAIIESMGEGARSGMHRLAARVLAEEEADPLVVGAHLLRCAPASDEWVAGKLREASEHALRHGSPQTAVSYLERATQELPANSPLVRDYQLELARAEVRIPRSTAIARYQGLISAEERPQGRARLALELAPALGLLSSDPCAAVELLEAVLSALGNDEEALRRDLILAAVSQARLDARMRPRVMAYVRQLASMAEPVSSKQRFALEVNLAREAQLRADPVETCLSHLDIALPAADELLGETRYEGPLAMCIVTLAYAGRTRDALELAVRMEQASRSAGDWHMMALAIQYQAMAHWRAGQVGRMEVDARRSTDLLCDEVFISPQGIGLMLEMLLDADRLDEATELLDRSGLSASDLVVRNPTQLVVEARARLHLLVGNPTAALHDARAVGSWRTLDGAINPEVSQWRGIASLALRRLGDVAEAVRLAEEACDVARSYGTPRAIGTTLRVRGLVGERIEDLARSVAVLRDAGIPSEHAESLVGLGRALSRRNRTQAALASLREGMDVATRCGAARVANLAHRELRAAGARPRRRLVSGVGSLTPSERRVCELARDGFSNQQIAQFLFVNVKTVEGHLRNAYRKLDIRRRQDLATEFERWSDSEGLTSGTGSSR